MTRQKWIAAPMLAVLLTVLLARSGHAQVSVEEANARLKAREQLAGLKAEIERVRKENAALRTRLAALKKELAELHAKPGSKTETPAAADAGKPADGIDFRSFEQMVAGLPADCRPARGIGWDQVSAAHLNAWAQDHLVGKTCQFTCKLNHALVTPIVDTNNPAKVFYYQISLFCDEATVRIAGIDARWKFDNAFTIHGDEALSKKLDVPHPGSIVVRGACKGLVADGTAPGVKSDQSSLVLYLGQVKLITPAGAK